MPKCSKCGGYVCAWCGRPVRWLEHYGRPPKYCSEKHKKAAERQRAKERRKQVPLDHYNGDEQDATSRGDGEEDGLPGHLPV